VKTYERVEFKRNLLEPAYDTNRICMYYILRFGLGYNPVGPTNYQLSTCSSYELKITTN
jgi:hypothetical protein